MLARGDAPSRASEARIDTISPTHTTDRTCASEEGELRNETRWSVPVGCFMRLP